MAHDQKTFEMVTKVSNRFYEMAKQTNDWSTIREELYGDDIVSIEPERAQFLKSTVGKKAAMEKGVQFLSSIEKFHSGEISKPLVAANFFSVSIILDVMVKGVGRMRMEEIAVYEVGDNKIVKEQFFF